jgi:hypothetical protein
VSIPASSYSHANGYTNGFTHDYSINPTSVSSSATPLGSSGFSPSQIELPPSPLGVSPSSPSRFLNLDDEIPWSLPVSDLDAQKGKEKLTSSTDSMGIGITCRSPSSSSFFFFSSLSFSHSHSRVRSDGRSRYSLLVWCRLKGAGSCT